MQLSMNSECERTSRLGLNPTQMTSRSVFSRRLLTALSLVILCTVADVAAASRPTFGKGLPLALAAHPSRVLVKYKSNSKAVAAGASALKLIQMHTLPANESVATAVKRLEAQPGEPEVAKKGCC